MSNEIDFNNEEAYLELKRKLIIEKLRNDIRVSQAAEKASLRSEAAMAAKELSFKKTAEAQEELRYNQRLQRPLIESKVQKCRNGDVSMNRAPSFVSRTPTENANVQLNRASSSASESTNFLERAASAASAKVHQTKLHWAGRYVNFVSLGLS